MCNVLMVKCWMKRILAMIDKILIIVMCILVILVLNVIENFGWMVISVNYIQNWMDVYLLMRMSACIVIKRIDISFKQKVELIVFYRQNLMMNLLKQNHQTISLDMFKTVNTIINAQINITMELT